MGEKLIGKITHYFAKPGVAALALEEPMEKGSRIRIHGHTTDLTQAVESMEVDHQPIERGEPGQAVAIKVAGRVRPHDEVYLLED